MISGFISHEEELDTYINNIKADLSFVNGFVIKPFRCFGSLRIIVLNKRYDFDNNVNDGEIYYDIASSFVREKIFLQSD